MAVGRLPLVASGIMALAILAAGCTSSPMVPIYLGTYTDGASRGIYRLTLDSANARLSEPVLVAEATNPSFLAWHPTQSVLYAVSETDTVGAGEVRRTDGLPRRRLGRTDANQPGAQRRGRRLLRVGQRGGHVRIRRQLWGRQRRGTARPRRWRSEAGVGGRAAHGIRSARDAADPRARALDSRDARQPVRARGRPRRRPALRVSLRRIYGCLAAAPAAGGRGIARGRAASFRAAPVRRCRVPDERVELDGRHVRVGWQRPAHSTTRGEVSTLPDGFAGENTTAEVAVHPNGRFVYGSNRGNDSIAAFRVGDDRTLTRVGVYPTGGRTPRHFAIDPTGAFLSPPIRSPTPSCCSGSTRTPAPLRRPEHVPMCRHRSTSACVRRGELRRDTQAAGCRLQALGVSGLRPSRRQALRL